MRSTYWSGRVLKSSISALFLITFDGFSMPGVADVTVFSPGWRGRAPRW